MLILKLILKKKFLRIYIDFFFQVRSRSLNHLDTLEMRQGVTTTTDAALKDSRSEPDCTRPLLVPPIGASNSTSPTPQTRDVPAARRHMLSRSQVRLIKLPSRSMPRIYAKKRIRKIFFRLAISDVNFKGLDFLEISTLEFLLELQSQIASLNHYIDLSF